MQIIVKSLYIVVVVLLADTWTINAVSFDGEFQMENWGIKICVFMPSSFKKSLFETVILFANEYFCFFVKPEPPAIHYPLGRIFNFLPFIFGRYYLRLPTDKMFSLFYGWDSVGCFWLDVLFTKHIIELWSVSTFGFLSHFDFLPGRSYFILPYSSFLFIDLEIY